VITGKNKRGLKRSDVGLTENYRISDGGEETSDARVSAEGLAMYFDLQDRFRLPDVTLLEDEYERLFDLICASPRATPGIALLWQELQRAERVRAGEAPEDVVHLGSLVSFTDLTSGRRHAARVVTPDGCAERRRISVTTTNGAALIGLRPGDTFSWSLPTGARGALHIDEVTKDPGRQSRLAEARASSRRDRMRELLSLS
jgi:regulator of nucleoside diphosphate kinase